MTVEVIVVGAGPTGLMLASELRLHGAQPVVLECRAARDSTPRANGLVGQVVQLVDFRGLYQPLARAEPLGWLQRRVTGLRADRPTPARRYMFGGFSLDLRPLADSPLSILPVPQARLEAILEARAYELGVEVRRGHELLDVAVTDDGVTVSVGGPEGAYELRAAYLVGCDGATARSASSPASTSPATRGPTSSPVTRTWCCRDRS